MRGSCPHVPVLRDFEADIRRFLRPLEEAYNYPVLANETRFYADAIGWTDDAGNRLGATNPKP